MDKSDKNGSSLKAHLMKVWNSTGKMPQKLDAPYFPSAVAYVWTWFNELSNARVSTGFGVSPITYSEILAWSQLTDSEPTPWEVAVIKMLDVLFIREYSSKVE